MFVNACPRKMPLISFFHLHCGHTPILALISMHGCSHTELNRQLAIGLHCVASSARIPTNDVFLYSHKLESMHKEVE